MSIVKTISNEYEFAEWLKQSDSYSNNFSFEGANAVQAYYEQLSDDLGKNIEFDPVAWCCEWSEYDNLMDFNNQYFGENSSLYLDITALQDRTTVIELDNNRVLVQEF